MYKNILVALENSPTDRVILEHIRDLARAMSARLHLVHIADGFVARNQEQFNLEDSEEIVKDRKYLETTCAELKAEGFDASYTLGRGEPARGILHTVSEQSCDLIAMATHGHKLVGDFIFGSVADEVRHSTSVPVLLVREPKN